MNGLLPAGTIVFVDAVHPEYQSRPVHGWFIRSEKPAIRSTTGRRRLNLHAAFDLERMGATIVEGEKPLPTQPFGCSKNWNGTTRATG